MTALLAESVLEKQPGADILYDVRASRAVPDTVARLGGTAHVNRVGHAFFKRRMRDEGGAFGGEVSGHYYFADFYNADSGTIPALLILELLSTHDATLSELLEPLRDHYFISGEINSDGRRPRRQDGGDRGAATGTGRSRSSTASRSTTTTGTSTCGRRTPSRCCASTSRASSPSEDMERRRDEVLDAHPLMTADIHCLSIPTPFAVGRVNCYLIDDDPLTLIDTGPNSGKALDELDTRCASTATRSRA